MPPDSVEPSEIGEMINRNSSSTRCIPLRVKQNLTLAYIIRTAFNRKKTLEIFKRYFEVCLNNVFPFADAAVFICQKKILGWMDDC